VIMNHEGATSGHLVADPILWKTFCPWFEMVSLTYRVGVTPAYELAELNPIYKAIRSRDIQGARQAMENHLLNAAARLPSVEDHCEFDEDEEVM